MTSNDLMPFGKWGKAKLGDAAKTVGWIATHEPGYVAWLISQDGFAAKNPAMYAFFTKGEEASSTPKEREAASTGITLLAAMPEAFVEFWNRCYGDRLRKDGEVHYIAYLRVAITAWESAIEYCDMRVQHRLVAETPRQVANAANVHAALSMDLPKAEDPVERPDPNSVRGVYINTKVVGEKSTWPNRPKVGGDGRDEEVNF